jgi:hypothetical protein
MSTYQAGSLADIAEMFERFASTAAATAEHARTQREKSYETGRAGAWRDAARMLRKTTIAPTEAQP